MCDAKVGDVKGLYRVFSYGRGERKSDGGRVREKERRRRRRRFQIEIPITPPTIKNLY